MRSSRNWPEHEHSSHTEVIAQSLVNEKVMRDKGSSMLSKSPRFPHSNRIYHDSPPTRYALVGCHDKCGWNVNGHIYTDPISHTCPCKMSLLLLVRSLLTHWAHYFLSYTGRRNCDFQAFFVILTILTISFCRRERQFGFLHFQGIFHGFCPVRWHFLSSFLR